MSSVPSPLSPRIPPHLLTTLAQPVFARTPGGFAVHFVEFLTRGPSSTNFEAAAVLFEYARRKNQECALDRVCITRALDAARRLPEGVPVSLNVHASTLESDRDLPRLLAENGSVEPSRIILEIVEHAPAWASHAFDRALDQVRALGVRIALDDVGAGQASFRMILDCAPDYLKVDQSIVRGCARDLRRRAVLESLATLAARLGSRVVAEGIETEAERDAVEGLGIDLLQGYLLAAPGPVDAVSFFLEEGVRPVTPRPRPLSAGHGPPTAH